MLQIVNCFISNCKLLKGKGSPGLIAKMGTAEKLDQKIINPAADL